MSRLNGASPPLTGRQSLGTASARAHRAFLEPTKERGPGSLFESGPRSVCPLACPHQCQLSFPTASDGSSCSSQEKCRKDSAAKEALRCPHAGPEAQLCQQSLGLPSVVERVPTSPWPGSRDIEESGDTGEGPAVERQSDGSNPYFPMCRLCPRG